MVISNRGFHTIAQFELRHSLRDLTNNLKLMLLEVVERLILEEPGFAVNAVTGLQPLVMGYRVSEVPISWINRAPDMWASSFRLMRAGGGYWRVLRRLWRRVNLGGGAYAALAVARGESTTWFRAESASHRPAAVAPARASTGL